MRCSVARSSASDPSVRSYTRSTRRSSDEPFPSVAIARDSRSASRIRIAARLARRRCLARLTRATSSRVRGAHARATSRARDDVPRRSPHAPCVSPRAAALTLVTAAALGVGAQYLFVQQIVGLNLLVATILLLAAAWRTQPRRGLSKIDLVLPAGAIAFAALGAIRVDAPLVVFDVLAALALSIGSAVAFRGVSPLRMSLYTLLVAGLNAGATTLGGGASVLRDGRPGLGALLPARSSRGVAQLGGVALATPFLVVFAVLFSSADAVFRHLVEGAIDADELRRLYAELPVRTVVAAVAAWIAAGVLRTVTA